jgi:hypothetical protein
MAHEFTVPSGFRARLKSGKSRSTESETTRITTDGIPRAAAAATNS